MTKSRTMSYSIQTRNLTQVRQGRGFHPKEEELEASKPTNDHRLSNFISNCGRRLTLKPLPIPEKPWVSLSMDFITGLPKVKDFGLIMVVVDRFSKYASFSLAPHACTAEVPADLFFKNVVKYWSG